MYEFGQQSSNCSPLQHPGESGNKTFFLQSANLSCLSKHLLVGREYGVIPSQRRTGGPCETTKRSVLQRGFEQIMINT